jgi:formylglycine-generating enzyme required for sulfatase activity
VGCIAALPEILDIRLDGDSLHIRASRGDRILLWAGEPSYEGISVTLSTDVQTVSLKDHFGRYEGTFVVQLFARNRLMDERVVYLPPGTPRLVSHLHRTRPASAPPPGMVEIPGARIAPRLSHEQDTGANVTPYPDRYENGDTFYVAPFYMDKYPVTNAQFRQFLDESGYAPSESVNFLKHWENGQAPAGQENYPVVYVSLDDARAYAEWAGKRLPTEPEWQLAAQGTDGRTWPWGDTFDSTRVNVGRNAPTAVDAFPTGAGPYGVTDLVGNVWQLTNDVYDNGSYRYVIIRGGSYYFPSSSWWYAQGGPRPLDEHQVLILVAPSLDRSATIGFRTVKDR